MKGSFQLFVLRHYLSHEQDKSWVSPFIKRGVLLFGLVLRRKKLAYGPEYWDYLVTYNEASCIRKGRRVVNTKKGRNSSDVLRYVVRASQITR